MNRRRLRALPTIADMAKAFGCVDAMLDKLSQGWIHEMQGHPVFHNPSNDTWYDIPEALAGWVALWERIRNTHRLDIDMRPVAKLAARLNHGVPIRPEEVATCMEIVKACKRAYRKLDIYEIKQMVSTTMIEVQVELHGLRGATA